MIAIPAGGNPRRPGAAPRRRPAASKSAERSRAARRQDELAMTPGERLSLALELSDICANLAAAGRTVIEGRS